LPPRAIQVESIFNGEADEYLKVSPDAGIDDEEIVICAFKNPKQVEQITMIARTNFLMKTNISKIFLLIIFLYPKNYRFLQEYGK
jgi:hypothetical protein